MRIAADLRRQVAAGEIAPGHLLPSESDLARMYSASRATVRKALAQLRQEGIADSRQGFGWYVAATPLRQSLRDLTTIERQIRAAGRTPSRKLLSFEFTPTPAWLSDLLTTDRVLEFRRLDYIDGQPFATATVWVNGTLAAALSPRALEGRPLSEQLGIELGGATETITALGADRRDAELLAVPPGAALLRIDRITTDTAGRPVLRSHARYNPLLTELVAELPAATCDLESPGLRVIGGQPQDVRKT
jgi:GntR family transcriptional regulator